MEKSKDDDLSKLIGKIYTSKKHNVSFKISIACRPFTCKGLQNVKVGLSGNADYYDLEDGVAINAKQD